MKRLFILAAAVLMVLPSCTKEQNGQQDAIQLTLTAKIASPTKASYTDDNGIKMSWDATERISIVTFKDDMAVSVQELTSIGDEGREDAVFSGSFTPTDGATYLAVYPPLMDRGSYWITENSTLQSDIGLRINKNDNVYLSWRSTNPQNYQAENGSLDIVKWADVMVGTVSITDGTATTSLQKTISVLKLVLTLPAEAPEQKLYSIQVHQKEGKSITTGTWVQYNQLETPFVWYGGGISTVQLGLGSASGIDIPASKKVVAYIPGAYGQLPVGDITITLYASVVSEYSKTLTIDELKPMQAGYVYTINADLQ